MSNSDSDDAEPVGTTVQTGLSPEKQAYLHLGLTLQDVQARGCFNITKLIPHFVLTGYQSVGKTTLLNIFAGRCIAGGISSTAGTMRPIVYRFETTQSKARRIRVNDQKHEFDSDQALYDFIDKHMKPLQKDKKYESKPLFVYISGPDCFNIVVEDTPGLPAVQSAEYESIKKIMAERINQPHVVPILVQLLDQVLDVSKVVSQMKEIRNAWGATKKVQQQGVFVLNGLNVIQGNVTNRLTRLVNELQNNNFSHKNLVMTCLKWENMVQPPEEHNLALNEYFKTFCVKEEEKLHNYALQYGLVSNKYNLGCTAVKRLLQDTVVEYAKKNADKVRKEIKSELKKLQWEASDILRKTVNPREIQQRATALVHFFAGVFNEVANADMPNLINHFKDLSDMYPKYTRGLDSKLAYSLIEKVKLTYIDEVETIMEGSERDEYDNRQFSDNLFTQECFDMANETPDAFFTESLDMLLSGAGAIRRANSALRFAVVSQKPLSVADIATLVNHESYVPKTGVQNTDLLKIVRDLAIKYQITHQNLRFISKHHAGIYTRIAEIVLKHMRGHVMLLDDVQNLRDIVCEKVKNEYKNLFDIAAKRTAQDTGKVLSALGITLDLGTFTAMIRALACCPLPPQLVLDARVKEVDLGTNGFNELKKEMGLDEWTQPQCQLMSMIKSLGSASVQETKTEYEEDPDPIKLVLANLPAMNAPSALFDYAEMKRLRTINFSTISELKKYLEPINKLAHSIAKLNNCFVIHVLTILLKRNVSTVSHHVSSRLPTNLQNKVIAPIFSNEKKTNAIIYGVNETRRKRVHATLTKLSTMLEAADALNKASRKLDTNHTIKVEAAKKAQDELHKWLDKFGEKTPNHPGSVVDLDADNDSDSGVDSDSEDDDSPMRSSKNGWPKDIQLSLAEMQQLLCDKDREMEALRERPTQLQDEIHCLRAQLEQQQNAKRQLENELESVRQELTDAQQQVVSDNGAAAAAVTTPATQVS